MRNRIICSLFSAILLSLGWLSLSGITLLVALVPLLWVSGSYDVGRKGFWKTFGYMAVALGLWSAATTWWIWYAAPIGAILSVLITVCLMGVPFMLYHYTGKRAPRGLAYMILVCGWIACEYLYTVGDVSFPWLTLGNGMSNDAPIVQWYEYTGVFGGSLWILVSNIFVYEALLARSKSKWIAAGAWAVVPVVFSLVIFWTYREKGEKITATVVQPNIDPYTEKFSVGVQEQMNILLSLSRGAPEGVDFIVMPESAIDDRLWDGFLEDAPAVNSLRSVLREDYPGAQMIVGAMTFKRYMPGEKISSTARSTRSSDIYYDVYNSAMAVDTTQRVDIHHKSILVVGVEKMPWRWLTKAIDRLIVDLGGTTGQLGVDTVQRVFTSPEGIRSATAICYESVYGGYFANFAARGAELMFVITNDGWWGDTQGHRNHFSFARLRAIESRRSIARSANTGISGFIDQRGSVLDKICWDIRATSTRELSLNDKITFYSRFGDYIARLSCYVLAVSLLYYPAYRIRRRNHLVK